MLPHSPIPNVSLPIIRILIGSYFLASVSLIDSFGNGDVLAGLLPPAVGNALSGSILGATALAVMLGVFIRPASLILALFAFWASFLRYAPSFTFANLTEFWRDMALVGAVLLIAETTPTRLRLRRPQARRVTVTTNPFNGRRSLTTSANSVGRPSVKRRMPKDDDAADNIFREAI